MSANEQRIEETIIVGAASHDGEEIIDVEIFVREKKPIPHGHKYKIRIDKDYYIVDVSHMTGEQILGLAGKSSAGYLLSEKVHGQMRPVAPGETVDFTAHGVERFATIPKEVREGEGPVRADFAVMAEDAEFLNGKAYTWEAVAQHEHEHDTKRIVVRGFEPPPGFSPAKVDMFVILPQGYPDTQIDMVYFYPALARNDGKQIPSLVTNAFEDKTWQGWSRHRTENSPWRQGIDNVGTHLMLVDDFLRAELLK
ncbi:multiubiquitin domain-containing protein [Ralstonia pseudosolanacearum]|uniref:multiubiquitin domain-containing protein n=1 Tax=Ralstonia pseudosolanacearum TaxID=1310165 RepID=UPI0026758FF0|nr:multiubiquitin domain-containing protein [Ralstonia pseudosolanacearum]MDO3523969.1 multiubiquitin domain-containing protein [Ralstonia pseudosolanacearum]MDO3549457.1 multiubiquitin domain-containing protein [Ralstonia pseudosolanacearum]MDO3553412.1 multiubiquitin domain-containing protein [Ralstonia pseudosolanacearum]MDO3567272.1 multiubiquitin domain-containing protein [Ralstonia pseudosolanacearum]MDO3582824.1 multiubiquitin domain-containing protein [Ralstonia pseudosolanacearum]